MNVVFSKKNLLITSLLTERASQFALCVENRSLKWKRPTWNVVLYITAAPKQVTKIDTALYVKKVPHPCCRLTLTLTSQTLICRYL